jgi:putative hydrolase of the HAD superfamily
VLTNGLSETHLPKAEALGISPFVEAVFTPDTLGVAKPDPEAFRRACERLGSSPEEAVHVGDSLITDVGGAREAGLRAVWFNPDNRPFDGEHIASLPELIPRLRG